MVVKKTKLCLFWGNLVYVDYWLALCWSKLPHQLRSKISSLVLRRDKVCWVCLPWFPPYCHVNKDNTVKNNWIQGYSIFRHTLVRPKCLWLTMMNCDPVVPTKNRPYAFATGEPQRNIHLWIFSEQILLQSGFWQTSMLGRQNLPVAQASLQAKWASTGWCAGKNLPLSWR